MSRARLALPLLALVVAVASAAGPNRAEPSSYTLIRLDPARARIATAELARRGGVLLSRELAIWRLRSDEARRLLPRLRRERLVRVVEPDRPIHPSTHLSAGDPLIPSEWWLRAVGADVAEPPGPGRPLTVVDTGLDPTHPEFSARPNTIPMNPQVIGPERLELHGTAVSSVAAAPSDGVGLVGVYPQAVLREWDVGESASGVIAGLETASLAGPGVINISLGLSPSQLLEDAIDAAVRRGSIVVAAIGNEHQQGNPVVFPAILPHVLTVASTDQAGNVSSFSNEWPAVDVSAPGEAIPVAVPASIDPSGYAVATGTSFSTPIVAGAAAWIWTARPDLDASQVVAVLHSSAKDIGPPGFDPESGYGLLDIPAALQAPAPPSDPQEPNDDIRLVKPHGLFAGGLKPMLARSGPPRATISGSVDRVEDPSDVYPFYVPGRSSVTATVIGDADVDLEIWRPGTTSVGENLEQRHADLAGRSAHRTVQRETLTVGNTAAAGRFFYVRVLPGRAAVRADYTLTLVARVRR